MKTPGYHSRFYLWMLGLLAAWVSLFTASSRGFAHNHIDVQSDSNQLLLVGPGTETMLYVPPGEPFTNYATQFPGGYYACELTFTSEDPGPLPRIQLLSVAGPAGASFAFWEAGATTPTWSRVTGWTSTNQDRPTFVTYEDGTGYGHIHGRLFTATHPGTYTVHFRAVDDRTPSPRSPSEPHIITFTVLATPPLTLRIVNSEARLSFTGRLYLTYDLQVSTDLQTWSNVDPHTFLVGTGSLIELADPIADRPRVFYRLVEYY